MNRRSSALGLALVASFAIGALIASPASAQQGKLTAEGPVTLSLTQTGAVGSGANAFTAFGYKVECPASVYNGHKYNVTPHESIPSGATEVTVTPQYINCFAETTGGAVFSTTVSMNGCDYAIHIGETTGGENTYGVSTDVVCPEGQEIQLTGFLGPAHESKVCTLKIKPQTGLSGAHLTTNTVADDVGLVGSFEKVHVERSGLCTTDGKGTTETNGKIDLDVTVKGRNEEGQPAGITVTG